MAVEAHGGHIWVESEGEGKGATFNVTLPLLKQEPEDRSQNSA
jgi:signal transduction histidine kinase